MIGVRRRLITRGCGGLEVSVNLHIADDGGIRPSNSLAVQALARRSSRDEFDTHHLHGGASRPVFQPWIGVDPLNHISRRKGGTIPADCRARMDRWDPVW